MCSSAGTGAIAATSGVIPSCSGRGSEEGNLAALHPTVKPVQLVADAILDCSARGDAVLDSFVGSGTSLIAALVGERAAHD
jgi:DNA modification methylase